MNKTSNNFQLVKITRRYKASFAEMVLIFAFAAIVGYFIETGYVFLVVGKIVKRGIKYNLLCK